MADSDHLADVPEDWPVVSSEDLFRDDWVMALRADLVQRRGHPDDEPFRRLVLEHPGAVVILALDDDERALCVRQYRHPARRRFVELPAGLIDQDSEDPLDVARRELIEETGNRAESWTAIGATYSSPGISSEVIHYYLARGLSAATDEDSRGFVAAHEEADMETVWVAFDDLVAAVLDGRVTDAPVAVAVLMAQARGLAGKHP